MASQLITNGRNLPVKKLITSLKQYICIRLLDQSFIPEITQALKFSFIDQILFLSKASNLNSNAISDENKVQIYFF